MTLYNFILLNEIIQKNNNKYGSRILLKKSTIIEKVSCNMIFFSKADAEVNLLEEFLMIIEVS